MAVKSVVMMMLLFCTLCGPVHADDEASALTDSQVRAAIDRLCGEKLSYDIAFLWFDRLATGDFSLAKTENPDHYRAVLEARTLGLAAWLTSDRVQRYISELFLAPDGSLRPVRHDADIFKTKKGERKSRLKRQVYDYARRRVVETVIRNARPGTEKIYPLSGGPMPYDILAAFYNFRAGLYGPLAGGMRFQIPTFAKGGTSDIGIYVYPEGKRLAEAKFPKGGLVVRVQLDPEVFDTGNGTLFIWFDQAGQPARVLVKDVIGLGDVRATLHPRKEKEI